VSQPGPANEGGTQAGDGVDHRSRRTGRRKAAVDIGLDRRAEEGGGPLPRDQGPVSPEAGKVPPDGQALIVDRDRTEAAPERL
jgi:hypothetical protein